MDEICVDAFSFLLLLRSYILLLASCYCYRVFWWPTDPAVCRGQPQGANPPPSSTREKAGTNHLNEEITPLLPTGIGEWFSQTISNLCNGGALYAPYSYLSISNMLCGGGGGEKVVTLAAAYHAVFRVIIYGPWISQASVTYHTMPAPTGLPLLALKLHCHFDISGITAVYCRLRCYNPCCCWCPCFFLASYSWANDILIVYCVSSVACFADEVVK